MPTATNPNARRVIDACEPNFEANQGDCNKFLKAVSNSLGSNIPQDQDANGIVEFLDAGNGWTKLADGDGHAAKQMADAGNFVVAGLRGSEHADHRAHGHVSVIVSAALDPNGYPIGYWGSISPGVARKYTSIRKAWQQLDADKLHYYWKSV